MTSEAARQADVAAESLRGLNHAGDPNTVVTGVSREFLQAAAAAGALQEALAQAHELLASAARSAPSSLTPAR